MNAKNKYKNVIDNLDLIPYIYSIPEEFQKKINSYNPTSRNQKMGLDCIGTGISREVYPFPGKENLIIKISKKYKKQNSVSRANDQSKNEIIAFLNFNHIRKWMPQIYNYDKKEYNWIIAERCDTDLNKIKSLIKEYDSVRLSLINQTLSTEDEVYSKPFLPIRKRIDATLTKIKKNKMFLEVLDLDNLDLKNHEYVYNKFGKSPKKDKLNLYYDWATLLNPMVVDLAKESIESGVSIRDLHDSNLGLSLGCKEENSLRILDLGVFNL